MTASSVQPHLKDSQESQSLRFYIDANAHKYLAVPRQPAAIGAVGFEPEPFVWTATAQSTLGKVDRARQPLIQVKSGNITYGVLLTL